MTMLIFVVNAVCSNHQESKTVLVNGSDVQDEAYSNPLVCFARTAGGDFLFGELYGYDK